LGLVLVLASCHAANAPGVNRPVIKPAGNSASNTANAPRIAQPSQGDDYISFEGGVKVFPARRRVEVRAALLGNQRRPLEFLVVGPGGSAHEAMFATYARAESVKRGLEIIGLREAKEKGQGRGYPETPGGDGVRISVIYKNRDTGESQVVRVEDWLWDVILKRTPPHGLFVFTGGVEQYLPELNRSVIAADELGNMVAVWHDASCIVDNAHKHGGVSDVYSPNPDAPGIPQIGSEVTLVFEPEKP
jgi:hypothetical protein